MKRRPESMIGFTYTWENGAMRDPPVGRRNPDCPPNRIGAIPRDRRPIMSITLADIEAARGVIAGHVIRTPMLPAPRLSELTGASVYVKYENLQVTNSFKERGARNRLASLSAADRERGVIAMSAGNHAQAVAYHA